jgi:hypothetical protein
MKIAFVFSILIFTVVVSEAQMFNSVEISNGLSMATQTSTFKDKDRNQRETMRPGFNIMLRMTGRINGMLSFSSDIGYVQKGYHYDVQKTISLTTTYDQLIHYITYGLQIKFGRKLGNFTPTVILGPRIDYQVGYEGKQEIDKIARFYNRSIFGMNAGMDFMYAFGKVGITALFLYQFDITKLRSTNNFTGTDYRNKALLMNIGLVFYLGNYGNEWF